MDSGQPEPSQWCWEEALKSAIHMNISLNDFNEMTPYELNLYAEAFTERLELEKEEKLTLVWLHEYYHRTKKLPDLKQEVDRMLGRKRVAMTEEELKRRVEVINKKLGGTETIVGGV